MTAAHTGTGYAELNAVLDQARRLSGHPIEMPEVSPAQLLGLQWRWTTALSARLDEAIESSHPDEGVQPVADAWRRLAADLPTLRGVLDSHEGRCTVLAEARSTEYRMLALAAGLAGLDAPAEEAVRAGRALVELIRSGPAEPSVRLAHAG